MRLVTFSARAAHAHTHTHTAAANECPEAAVIPLANAAPDRRSSAPAMLAICLF